MSAVNTPEHVQHQYSDDKNLATRISLHTKYSTNKQGFFPWLFDKYEFFSNCDILELGCGNGRQWEDRLDSLPDCCTLMLSDFSSGMVDTVRDKYSEHKNLSFRQIDIQDISLPDESFDIVIANHMLYHVPDLPKALSEVKRVLKPGGKFYSATNGNGGMRIFINEVLDKFTANSSPFAQEFSFSLQNGHDILNEYFFDIQKFDYNDSFSITETRDLIDFIKSTISYSIPDAEELYGHLENMRKRDGAINVPKEAGLFISTKR